MISYLRDATIRNQSLHPDVIPIINSLDRADFIDFNSYTPEQKQKYKTPYTFLAHPFYKDQTIPSAHKRINFLNKALKEWKNKNLKLLEIGAGALYSSILLSKACPDLLINSSEIIPKIANIAQANLNKYNLENHINIIDTSKNTKSIEEDAPYDIITSTLALSNQTHLENLLDLLDKNGELDICFVKKGNTKNKTNAQIWHPNESITSREIYHSPTSVDKVRAISYIFKKRKDKVFYAHSPTGGGLSPLLK